MLYQCDYSYFRNGEHAFVFFMLLDTRVLLMPCEIWMTASVWSSYSPPCLGSSQLNFKLFKNVEDFQVTLISSLRSFMCCISSIKPHDVLCV